ncbi:tail fiber protein [Hymenobacter sp. 15J16-1T3B]|uniref:phage tail protein n=1 Tax=Hymenobacter sp. 15J16-1T3B TaxID=2886941 RepID=UPI001D106665|nr:tail fiber protein [Hymenobacter sp. 15J16-1T3B]MCC3156313.1 tail fiber protein [Hymenobacter sp. 15J16-1T3B]
MSTPYIGEIRAVGFTFAPVGWAFCNGQSLSISGNEALFQLIGTTYGGDGQSTFNVPDLRGRLGVGSQNGAAGPGLSSYLLGQKVGTESVSLNTTNLPPHQHTYSSKMAAASGGTATDNPQNAFPGPSAGAPYLASGGASQNLNAAALSGLAQPVGGGQPHSNIQPVLAMNYIICLEGIFPPQQ